MTAPAVLGIALDRVVAVVAVSSDGEYQTGSGYLVTGRRVLTAEHCTRVTESLCTRGELQVYRASDGKKASGVRVLASAPAVRQGTGLDVAVLGLDDAPWPAELETPVFARVDRTRGGVLENCQAIGYPRFQYRPDTHERRVAELHGTIYQLDLAESGRLLMREPRLETVTTPIGEADTGGSAWGGLSGAVVFHNGYALGVVVEHHRREGAASMELTAFGQLLDRAAHSPEARDVAAALGLSSDAVLTWAVAQSVEPLTDLVEILAGGDLPPLSTLDPYQLGATSSDYGDRDTYRRHDPYVPRTSGRVDDRLGTALRPGTLTILVGPSKAGKSRTAFEVARRQWPAANLLVPSPSGSWSRLASHPRLATTSDPVMVWLDDIDRYLIGDDPLTSDRLNRLLDRPGPTVLLGTLRPEQRDRLRDKKSREFGRDTRLLLESATTVELDSTADSPTEQAAARAAYPLQALSDSGLAEALARGPELLAIYRDSAGQHNPLGHLVVRAAVDWARVGIVRPIPESDLRALVRDMMWDERPDLHVDDAAIDEALEWARMMPGQRQAALLFTHPLPGRKRGYRPFDYLVAADEGQNGAARKIPTHFWDQVLEHCVSDDVMRLGGMAYLRTVYKASKAAWEVAARAGNTDAMHNLAYLLEDRVDPPDLTLQPQNVT